jgi:integral membrane sensor domain MASE1
LRLPAILANALVLLAGIAVQAQARSRVDAWRGAAIALLAVVNVLAILLAPDVRVGVRARRRLWRIALLADGVLLAVALALAAAAWRHPVEAAPYALLALPMAITLAALRRPMP